MDFAGFERPSFTQVPDEVFDVLMPDLSGAELKVLLYICRRTFGFGRSAAKITLDQLLKGHRGRDGEVHDRGAGISSRGTLVTALKQLRDQGIIVVEGPDGRAKTYCLRFRSSCPKIGHQPSLLPESAGPKIGPAAGPKTGPAQDRKSDPHKTNSSRQTDGQTEKTSTATPSGDQNSDTPKVTWLTPYADAWLARFGGEMDHGKHLQPLAAVRKQLGDEEAQRRWRNYLSGSGTWASGAHFKSTLGEWVQRAHGGPTQSPTHPDFRPPDGGNRFADDEAIQERQQRRHGGAQ